MLRAIESLQENRNYFAAVHNEKRNPKLELLIWKRPKNFIPEF